MRVVSPDGDSRSINPDFTISANSCQAPYDTQLHAFLAFLPGCASPWGFPSFQVREMSSRVSGSFPRPSMRAILYTVKRRTGQHQAFVRPHTLGNASIPSFYDIPNAHEMPMSIKFSVRDFLKINTSTRHVPSLQRTLFNTNITDTDCERAPAVAYEHSMAQYRAMRSPSPK